MLCSPRLSLFGMSPCLLLSPVSDETQTLFCPEGVFGGFEDSDVSRDSVLTTCSFC